MTRVAVITEKDSVWALSAWEKTIPLLLDQGYDLRGLWCVNQKLGNLPERQVTCWYQSTFGHKTFVLLGLFYLISRTSRIVRAMLGSSVYTFKGLCQKYKIFYAEKKSPNDREISNWVIQEKVDIVIIMVGHIIKEPLLSAPIRGMVNKHAAALPKNKGLMPFIWAVISETKQGITFHQVNAEIDQGNILFQEIFQTPWKSMISFYCYVFSRYGFQLLSAIETMENGTFIRPSPESEGSYYSLPNRQDILEFRKKGGKIIRFSDLVSGIKL